MNQTDPRSWSPLPCLDPEEGAVIRLPPGKGTGYWAGAPGVTFDPNDKNFYLVYRLRRPRGVQPDRGGEVRIAVSKDGVQFDDIWSATKDKLESPSIERCALLRTPDGEWILYISYVDPTDQRWRVDGVSAERPDALDLKNRFPVLTAEDLSAEGVKDPFVFRVANLYHMIVSYATADNSTSADALHGTADAYNTGLIQSATGLAVSEDGRTWRWQGKVLGPEPGQWDAYCARIGCVWYRAPVWLALYDGSADVSQNYEERCGLAYSLDLRQFHRVTGSGPVWSNSNASGALRYFDVLPFPDSTFLYYEMARPDGSHDLRVYRIGED